jgi:hypothetical protein
VGAVVAAGVAAVVWKKKEKPQMDTDKHR